MAADDFPPDALKRRFEIEDAFVSPVAKTVLNTTSSLPLCWPLNKAIDKIRAQAEACRRTFATFGLAGSVPFY